MNSLMRFITLTIVMLCALPVYAADVPTINTQELQNRLGSAGLVVIDVRTNRDWKSSGQKILGAIREQPDQVASWADKYNKGDTLVLYCA